MNASRNFIKNDFFSTASYEISNISGSSKDFDLKFQVVL